MEKREIVEFFDLLSNHKTDGLECFLSDEGKDEVFERLRNIDENPLNKVQLNQLLIISGLAGITFGFYKYYWLTAYKKHTYDVRKVEDFDEIFLQEDDEEGTTESQIISLRHLRWGLRRIYIDALLYYGNISNGFNRLSRKKESELINFFEEQRSRTDIIKKRGHALDFKDIDKDHRYLISEMACKTYEAPFDSAQNLKTFLLERFAQVKKIGRTEILIKELLDKNFNPKKKTSKSKKEKTEGTVLVLFELPAADILEEKVRSTSDIERIYHNVYERFKQVREKAIQNTKNYLSLVDDLDVYVATSMRTKKDFMEMADTCEKIFSERKIRNLNLRYFDPTISAANGHEDKGLIECLMVRCAKALIYSAGLKESYGKDAEAAMALSSGKPVIFYCMDSTKADFYKKVHPLTKLIDFSTGVANGAMVTFEIKEVTELLCRIFENRMEYKIEQPQKGYFRLIELSTESPVRIQTNDELLTKSFWNYFDRFVRE